MSATVTKAGPYYSTGSISFSTLRSNFRSQLPDGSFNSDALPIKASELLRDTNVTPSSGEFSTNPIVPDSTENQYISTSNNWKTSQFRNSIKYYFITQTGTDDNTSSLSSPGFNITTQTWNSNLNKSVKKYLYINGTVGSATTSQPAASLSSEVYNLVIDVSGSILGAGGAGGGSNASYPVNGENGGNSLYVVSTGSVVTVNLKSTAQVYGGGGGGEKGKTGDDGATGTCYSYSSYSNGGCGGCPGCNGGDINDGCSSGGGCDCGKGGCRNTYYTTYCRHPNPYSVPGAAGGVGGNGGNGQGYTQTKTLGSIGVDGATGGCPNYGANGYKGETGGDGGDWGTAGGSTTNTGSLGSAGAAIIGSNYRVTGTQNSATIKGQF